MDYRPVSTRTRSKRAISLLEGYWEMKNSSGVSPASRSKQMRRSDQASVSPMGEASLRKLSIEWVVDHVEYLENQENDDVEAFDSQVIVIKKSGEKGKGKGAAVCLKRERSLGVDASSATIMDGCNGRAFSDNGVEFIDDNDDDGGGGGDGDDDDDDDEVVVSKDKEGGRGVDVVDVSDGGTNEDIDGVSVSENGEDVSSAERDDSSGENVEEFDEEYVMMSSEEECALTQAESSDEECNEVYVLSSGEECDLTEEESVEEECNEVYVLSSGEECDLTEEESVEEECDEVYEQEGKGETVEVGLNVLHLCSAHDTDFSIDQVCKEECLGVFPKRKDNAESDHPQSSSGQDINDGSEKLGHPEAVLAEESTRCDRSDDYKDLRLLKKEEDVGVGFKEDRNGYVRNQYMKSERESSFIEKKRTRAPKQKRVPTIAFQPPRVESLPLIFSFAKKPIIPEKSGYERELEKLFDEYDFVRACDNASTDSKAKVSNFTRSDNNRNVDKDETCVSSETAIDNGINDLQTAFNENEAAKRNEDEMHGGTSESGFDKGSKFDMQSAGENGVEAKKNNFSRSINTRKHGGSRPKPYELKEGVRKLTSKKGITGPKDGNAFSILLDSVYDKGEVSRERLPPFVDESLKDEAPRDGSLPLFFTIGHPPSPPPEKSAFEIEVDDLYDEYNFVRMSGEIGSTDFNVGEINDSVPPSEGVTQHVLCSQGKHVLELDEQVGLLCRFCPHVHLEIRYIVPDFAPNPYGKSGKRFYEEGNRSKLDIQCNEHSDSGYSSHAHTEGTVWDLIPGVESDMYPHQREGFEFIWRNLAGGIQLGKLAQPSAYDGDGCIISHAPGTGKTRLTIIFIQSYMKFNPSSRPLIVAPRTMLLTWEEEFKKWGFDIPFHNLNNPDFTGKEDEAARNLVKDGKRSEMTNLTRLVKLKSWAKTRSILGISYSLFEKICGVPTKKAKNRISRIRVEEAEQMSKILLEFPGLVVFDEGHNPRNNQSYSWNVLLKLKTRRRILLSGTPFQNNFEELYNTVRLVRPDWTTDLTCLGGFDKKQFASYQKRGRKRNARKCQFADDNKKLAKEVRDMISPFVHVYKGSILQDKLPGLRNSVVVLHPTALQQRYLDTSQRTVKGFKYEQIETKVSIHPSLLLNEERSLFHKEDEYSGDWESLTEIKLNPEGGVKARFVVDLIRLSQALNERVLIFSQWVDPLYFIRDLLRCQFHWQEGKEVIYMDGKCDAKERQSSMSDFNDASTKAKVLLATTKSCNEGISLVGASRVVLLDVAWNPSVVRQAISRAYRFGQKKIVYIYHLLMAGAKEEEKYSCQVEKNKLSELVFSCSDRKAAKKISAAVVTDKILEEMYQHEKLRHIFQKIEFLDDAS